MTAPASRYRLRSSARDGVSANPASSAAASTPTAHLAFMPIPTQAPAATHHRGSADTMRRRTRYRVSAQKKKSKVVVENRCAAPRYSPQAAVASAATTWPVRPAPSSRLIAAARTTNAASSRAGRRRSPMSVLPVRAAIARAASGVRAGWST